MTIQMKANEQYFPVVLFIMLHKRWFYLLSLWMEYSSVTIQMKANKECLPAMLFIMLYKVALTFESVNEILLCDHSKESY